VIKSSFFFPIYIGGLNRQGEDRGEEVEVEVDGISLTIFIVLLLDSFFF